MNTRASGISAWKAVDVNRAVFTKKDINARLNIMRWAVVVLQEATSYPSSSRSSNQSATLTRYTATSCSGTQE